MDWKLFASTFSLIFVAELPDKTAFATLLMATRGRPWPIFVGVAAAFVVQCAVAVSLGSLLGTLPERWVHLGAGLLFLGFAVMAWREDDEEEEAREIENAGISTRTEFWRSAWKAFVLIFIAEWGDLTQLATASLAAKFHSPLSIFAAATAALWCVTGIAIGVGHHAHKAIHPAVLKRIAAFAFAGVGAYFLWSWGRGN